MPNRDKFSVSVSLILVGLALSRFVELPAGKELVFLSLIIVAEYRTVDPSDPRYNLARLGLNVAAYLIALVLFALIYRIKARALLSATATAAGSGLLALELLRDTRQSPRRTGLYALIVGLVMGEVIWALNYWRMRSLTAGMSLLLAFYVLTGLSQQAVLGRLSRRVLLEFGLVALVGVALLLWLSP